MIENYQYPLILHSGMRKERIKFLKNCKKSANQLLNICKEAQNQPGYKGWEKRALFFTVRKLKDIVTEINQLLKDSSLDEYIEASKAINRIKSGQGLPYDSPDRVLYNLSQGWELPFRIIKYNPSYSIFYDLNWIIDGTVGDHRKIASGELPIEHLSDNNIEYRREKVIDKIQTTISANSNYKKSMQVLKSAVELSESANYIASSILLLTGIESLVRSLVKHIVANQRNDLDEEQLNNLIYGTYNSIEALIDKCDVRNDYPMTLSEISIARQYIDEPSLEHYHPLIVKTRAATKRFGQIKHNFIKSLSGKPIGEYGEHELKAILSSHQSELESLDLDGINDDVDKQYPVSYRVKIYFLVRRMKDLRNDLIHGDYRRFNTKHYNYISLAALDQVIDIIEDYKKIYQG